MSSDESIWRMRVLSTTLPEYVGELVRCKDCEWACEPDDDGGYDDHMLACTWWMSYSRSSGDLFVEEDDFCSKAEKRED